MPSPLQSPQLRRIIAAYTINRLGTWIGLVALMVSVFDQTHSAIAVAALLLCWQALPAFVVPLVVARIEASKRRGELTGLYLFEAVATACLAVLMSHFWLPAILLIAALDGTAALTASSLLRAEVAQTARKTVEGRPDTERWSPEQLDAETHEAERKANAALNVGFTVTFVLGPVIGGAIVAAAGAPAALFIDAATFVICGALLVDLHPYVEEAGGESVRARLRSAWRHINEAPLLRPLLLMEAVAIAFAESAWPIQVAFAKDTLHAGDRGYGLLLGTWGAGAVLGSLFFARSLRRGLGSLLSAGTFAVGLAYVAFAAAPSLILACVAALIGGVGNGVELPSLTSIVQRLSTKHLHGQMMGAVESITALSLAVGLPLGGALVALSSPRAAFLIVGLGVVATSGALFRLSRRTPTLARSDRESGPTLDSEALAEHPAPAQIRGS